MFSDDRYDDLYHDYEAQFDPMQYDRQARRKRKPQIKHQPKKTRQLVLEEIADVDGLEGGFQTTYRPGPFEAGWLLEALRTFYDQALITDVLARVRGGKEANVYCCAAHATTGETWLAAKVYRPRMFRNLRNDQLYREGRALINADGKEVKERDKRMLKAVAQKTAIGAQMQHTSWLQYEYRALQTLHAAGAAVPKPFAAGENGILMGYVGEMHAAAPTLSDVALDGDEAAALFNAVLRNIDIMLQHGIVHGDLSAYNILYWDGAITLIDFPQMIDVRANHQAAALLRRDLERVGDYFSTQGVRCDAEGLFRRLWQRYDPVSRRDADADASRWEADEE